MKAHCGWRAERSCVSLRKQKGRLVGKAGRHHQSRRKHPGSPLPSAAGISVGMDLGASILSSLHDIIH